MREQSPDRKTCQEAGSTGTHCRLDSSFFGLFFFFFSSKTLCLCVLSLIETQKWGEAIELQIELHPKVMGALKRWKWFPSSPVARHPALQSKYQVMDGALIISHWWFIGLDTFSSYKLWPNRTWPLFCPRLKPWQRSDQSINQSIIGARVRHRCLDWKSALTQQQSTRASGRVSASDWCFWTHLQGFC